MKMKPIKKNWKKPSPLLWTCEIQIVLHMICYENTKFSSCPGTNMRCQGPLGNARAQPHHWMYNLLIFNNLSDGDFRMPVKILDNITQYIIQNWTSLFLLLLVLFPFLFFVTRQEVRQCHLHRHWNRINNVK